MKLRHLECFLVLAEELHFGRAAEKLFIGQPPLSRTIKELERELEVTLFDRNKRSVKLTPCGEFLKAEGLKLFSNIENIKSELKAINNGQSGKLRIGYVDVAMLSFLPKLLVEFQEKMNVSTILYEVNYEDQIRAIKAGYLDLGFSFSAPNTKDISVTAISKESFLLILPPDHKLANRKKIDLKELQEDSFIAVNYHCAPDLSNKTKEVFTKNGLTPKITHETCQVSSVMKLVENGLGYSIVPESLRYANNLNVKFTEIKGMKEKAELFLLHLKEKTPRIKKALEIVLEYENKNVLKA